MKPRVKRIFLPRIRGVLLLLGVFLAFLLLFRALTIANQLNLLKLVFDSGADLKPIDNRVNVLLLGIPGGNHDGADLTDTILVLSFYEKKYTLSMISVPRDIWSETLKDKINSAYHYGEEKKTGGGLVLAKAVISDIVGLPIQHAVLIDFSGFTKIIDLLGGVTINVPQAFTDPSFPIPGKENDACNGDTKLSCRYEVLHFAAGPQLMDGTLALKYVRSRQADGIEGSDFARSRRQQEVLLALKNKLSSPKLLFSPGKLGELFAAFDAAITTDMNMGELLTLGKIFLRFSQTQMKSISLVDQLYSPPILWYGRYVLLPKIDFPSIHQYVKESLEN